MSAILPVQIYYYPMRGVGGFGFNVDITREFLATIKTTEVNKSSLETLAKENFEAIWRKRKGEYQYSCDLLGWQDSILHHISLPYGNAAGMSYTDDQEPGWVSNNIDSPDQMALCLAIMTNYFNHISAKLYFQNKTFKMTDKKDQE